MIESILNTPLTLTANDSVVSFTTDKRTRSVNCYGWLSHTEGSPLYKITEGGRYKITFTGTVTSATAGIVALGLYEDGVLLPGTTGAETLAAAGDLANIAIQTTIKVCCNDTTSISLASIPSVLATATLVSTDTQIPIITNGTFTIERLG